MKTLPLTVAALAALGLGATTLSAQAEMDANGDGMYSFEEMLAAFPTITEETFVTIDTTGDGLVDADELAAARTEGLVPATEG